MHHRWASGTRCPAAPHRPAAARSGAVPYAWRVIPRLRSALPLALLSGVLVLVAACVAGPATSFDPTGPCTTDGSAAGAYPDLEAMVPTAYEGRGPDTLDSGRNCSPENLGTLAGVGIEEVHFAGGTWDFGGERAAALVVFQAPGLTADAIAEFYATSARASSKTQIVGTTTTTIAGRIGHRLDTTSGDRLQTVVTWPSATDDSVNVVITNDLPDPKIAAAIDAFGGD